MTRLTMLLIAVALVLPGAASARPAADPHASSTSEASTARAAIAARDKHGVDQAAQQRKAAAVARYYASYGSPKPLAAPVQAPATVATDGNGLSWTLAIGAGIALMLAALGLGVYAGRTIRPRHIGA
jgi:hypothetical protein